MVHFRRKDKNPAASLLLSLTWQREMIDREEKREKREDVHRENGGKREHCDEEISKERWSMKGNERKSESSGQG